MTIHLLNSRIYVNFKRKLCKRWTQWFVKDDKTYNCHSNMRFPGYTTVIQWLSEIWTDSDPNIINDLSPASTENNSTSAAAENNAIPVTAVTSTSSDPIQGK